MLIANPLYDVVFKALMQNEKVAKFFIGTLLNQTVDAVEFKPQEFIYTDEIRGNSVLRLDFAATIKTETGELKKILIEIQKTKNPVDLMRFRNYLAEQYKKEDTVNNEKIILPIVTIYILGFNIQNIETPCIKVERNYRDLINNILIDKKNEFIEKLTHDSYVVQVGRITDRYQTKLDKLLSLFEQKYFIDETEITKDFKHTIDTFEIKIAADILHFAGTDPEERKKIASEREVWRSIHAMFADKEEEYQQKLKEKEKALEEKDKAIENKEKALEEKDKAIEEKDKIIEELMKKIKG